MGPSSAIVHYNPHLAHQGRWAEAFAAGFSRHGVDCETTHDVEAWGELHVVLGPHYALSQWRDHPRCVWLDRAFWGDPDCASVGWSCGAYRRFPKPDGVRSHPALQPWRSGRHALVLADYGDTGERLADLARPHMESVRIRRHPAEGGTGTLADALADVQIAIGNRTSALVEAAMLGCAVVCLDPFNPVAPVASRSVRDIRHADRAEWAQRLAWANWSRDEIESGECWACLTRCV